MAEQQRLTIEKAYSEPAIPQEERPSEDNESFFSDDLSSVEGEPNDIELEPSTSYNHGVSINVTAPECRPNGHTQNVVNSKFNPYFYNVGECRV